MCLALQHLFLMLLFFLIVNLCVFSILLLKTFQRTNDSLFAYFSLRTERLEDQSAIYFTRIKLNSWYTKITFAEEKQNKQLLHF
jgi:hypothetical protein